MPHVVHIKFKRNGQKNAKENKLMFYIKEDLLDCLEKQPLQSQKIIKIFTRTQMKGFWIGLGFKTLPKNLSLKHICKSRK